MNKFFLLSLLLLSALFSFAQEITLKITYNGNEVAGHKVSVLFGGAFLGSGTTDSGGNVTMTLSTLPSKSIDLKGEKSCEGARKSWEVSGFVTLDGNNFAHLKMEEPIGEMVDASGGFISEKMMVASYGLVCAGSSNSSSKSDGDIGNSEGSSEEPVLDSSNENDGVVGAPTLMTKEEALANQKQMLENKVANLGFKIDKKQGKIDSGKLQGDKKADAEENIKEWEIEKKIAQNKLEKTNLQIEKGILNKAERNQFKEKEKALKEELKSVKIAGKSKSTEMSPPSEETGSAVEENGEEVQEHLSSNEFAISESEVAEMSLAKLKTKKASLKTTLGKRKVKLKTRKSFMKPEEINSTEEEISQIETAIAIIDTELEKRNREE